MPSAGLLVIVGAVLCLGALLRAAPVAAEGVASDILPAEFPDQYSRGQSISVLQRPRPDYDPLGIDLGAFLVYPQLDTGLGYTDNVYATASHVVGDGYAAIDPTVTVQSNWNLNMISLGAGARLREFFSQSSENENGWFVNTDERLDITDLDSVSAGGTVEKTYLERDAGDYPADAAAAIGLFHTAAYLRGQHETGRVRISAAADFDGFRYDSVASLTGGSIPESTQDHDTWRLSGRGEYGLTPDDALFAQATYTRTDYTNSSQAIPGPTSNDNKLLVGATFDTASLVRGTVGVGVETRSFASPLYPSLTGVTAAVKVEYFPSELVTVTASFRRLIEDAAIAGSGGFFNTGADIRVDYEPWRKVLLDVQGDYERDAFAGIRRTDTIGSATVGAKYLISRRYQLHADLTYLHRTTSGVFSGPVVRGPVFDEVRFMLGVVIHP